MEYLENKEEAKPKAGVFWSWSPRHPPAGSQLAGLAKVKSAWRASERRHVHHQEYFSKKTKRTLQHAVWQERRTDSSSDSDLWDVPGDPRADEDEFLELKKQTVSPPCFFLIA